MATLSPEIDAYLAGRTTWRAEIARLRELLAETPLVESLKWRAPCYGLDDGNVVMIQVFKAYVALGFFRGSLLKDAKGLLVAPGESSQAMRQLRFSTVDEITKQKGAIKAYLKEAIALHRSGQKVAFTAKSELELPAELARALDAQPKLKKAFLALTPGRRRGYALHIAGAKQSTTRAARVEKHTPRILSGKGLND